jgi:hypothetical protein
MTKLIPRYQTGGVLDFIKYKGKIIQPKFTSITANNKDYIKANPIKLLPNTPITLTTPKDVIKGLQQSIQPEISRISNGPDYKSLLTFDNKSYLGRPDIAKAIGAGAVGLVRPGIAVASAVLNSKLLKKERDAAKNIIAPRVDAAIMPNRPIQSLPTEITDAYLKSISNIKSPKTADATTNIISAQMDNVNRLGAYDKLATAQVENLAKERARHDQIEGVNAQESVKASNESSKYAADVYNKKSAIDAEYAKGQQEYMNTWAYQALVEPIEKRIAYNMGNEAIQKSDTWNRLQNQITNAENRLKLEPENRLYKANLDSLLRQQANLPSNAPASYDGTMKYLFNFKTT